MRNNFFSYSFPYLIIVIIFYISFSGFVHSFIFSMLATVERFHNISYYFILQYDLFDVMMQDELCSIPRRYFYTSTASNNLNILRSCCKTYILEWKWSRKIQQCYWLHVSFLLLHMYKSTQPFASESPWLSSFIL